MGSAIGILVAGILAIPFVTYTQNLERCNTLKKFIYASIVYFTAVITTLFLILF